MSNSLEDKLLSYLQANKQRFEELFCDFLRIPSVSTGNTQPEAIEKAAQWLGEQFQQLGAQVELIRKGGSPIVFAEFDGPPDSPIVLVYGHYDVQPADPLDQWESPPFEPTRRDNVIVARGASDDKGQLLTHVFSTEAWLKTIGRLPIRLKFLIEGEEECGSPSLCKLLKEEAERLSCHAIVVSDTSQFGVGQPAITYGLRGIAYFELTVTGPNRDLHSGSYGGAVTNPANVLTRLLGSVCDRQGKICVPGFYDDIPTVDEAERQQLASLAFRDEDFWRQLGVEGGSGEEGFTALERRWLRPSFDISGLTAGYQGPGAKTIIPRNASAKFSFRLVPNQDAQKIAQALDEMFREMCPPGAKLDLQLLASCPPVLIDRNTFCMIAAIRAVEKAFGRPPVFIREGGSIPIIAEMYQKLCRDILLLGWAQPDDNAHGPNEKFSLVDFHRGISASMRLWHELAVAWQGKQ